MKSLTDYGLTYLDSIINSSDIAKLGIQIAQKQTDGSLSRRIAELSNAHYNSKEFYLKAYAKLNSVTLNFKNKSPAEIELLQPDVERATFVFITMSKNSLDLLACILDILENKIIRAENKLPDFYTRYVSTNSKIKDLLNEIRNSNWAILLKDYRDKLLHRGYTIAVHNEPDVCQLYMVKTETVFPDFENNRILEFTFGIELMDKTIIEVETVMQGLSFDLCKIEYEIANLFISENIVGLNPSEMGNWIIPVLKLIKNY